MNTSFVKSVPLGDFAEVSALMRGWEGKLQTFAKQKRPIRYDIYPLERIPQEIQNQLKQQGYCDLVLNNDRWQHFLVPNLVQTSSDRALNPGVSQKVNEPSFVAIRLVDTRH
jgi:hypothetical protein